jgi:hypothetical protein
MKEVSRSVVGTRIWVLIDVVKEQLLSGSGRRTQRRAGIINLADVEDRGLYHDCTT